MSNGIVGFDICEWLSTGDFAGVVMEMPKSEVACRLGPPDGWANDKVESDIEDFMGANIWGYGIWTLYFDGENLDAVTGSIDHLDELRFFFEPIDGELRKNSTIDEVLSALKMRGIESYELPREYCLLDKTSGSHVKRKKRGGDRDLLIGGDFLGRARFDSETGVLLQVAYPFCAAGPGITYRGVVAKENFILDIERTRDLSGGLRD